MNYTIPEVLSIGNEPIKRTIVLNGGKYVSNVLTADSNVTTIYIGYPESSETAASDEKWAIRKLTLTKTVEVADGGNVSRDYVEETWLNDNRAKIYAFTGTNITF